MLHNIGFMFIGAVLVTIGVLGAALADRIRGVKLERKRAVSAASTIWETPPSTYYAGPDKAAVARAKKPAAPMITVDPMLDEVVDLLVGTGYKKPTALVAANGCTPAERATIESWSRAALRRAAGRMS